MSFCSELSVAAPLHGFAFWFDVEFNGHSSNNHVNVSSPTNKRVKSDEAIVFSTALEDDPTHWQQEDVRLMHDIGLAAYRFSISWSRLIPDGRGTVNPKGLRCYNDLIDALVSYGIEPHVTLYHFDLPQAVQVEYEGLTSQRIM